MLSLYAEAALSSAGIYVLRATGIKDVACQIATTANVSTSTFIHDKGYNLPPDNTDPTPAVDECSNVQALGSILVVATLDLVHMRPFHIHPVAAHIVARLDGCRGSDFLDLGGGERGGWGGVCHGCESGHKGEDRETDTAEKLCESVGSVVVA